MTELMTLIFADQKTNTLPLIFTDDIDLRKPAIGKWQKQKQNITADVRG